jgi:iron(III) transport system substrate-binding protein
MKKGSILNKLITNFLIIATIIFAFVCCSKSTSKKIVVYTSHDQIYSEPIFKEFEEKTGIRVKAMYDVEAAKTTGLVNRLIAEKDNPQCDVFWNNENSRTIVLKKKGVLSPYISPAARDIPAQFKGPDGFWTGFAARARVLIYNTDLVKPEEVPGSIFELTDPKWKGQVALANPLFGTTATHCSALFIRMGDKRAKEYFNELKKNEVVIVDGNSTSRDRVQDGEIKIGFTDTDDANIAIMAGKPVGMVYPDKNGIGTLLIPNTVALIKGGPNPEGGKKFIDFLLSEKVESKLAFSESAQMPLRKGVKRPDNVPDFDSIKAMNVDYEKIADRMEDTGKYLQELYLR